MNFVLIKEKENLSATCKTYSNLEVIYLRYIYLYMRNNA